MPRLSEMSMRELEDAGQRYYEHLGRLNGEDGPSEKTCSDCAFAAYCCYDEHDPYDELVADPDDD